MKRSLVRSASCAALLLGASALSAAAAQTVGPLFDGFAGETNKGGWTYNPADQLPAEGGNPGGWLHQSFADNFAPIFVTTTELYFGDWRGAGVSRLTFDAINVDMDFGTGAGFSMTVLLRDTKGTGSVADDDYAYFVGPNVPIVGEGWTSYDFAIPSADTSEVPAGWKGGWSGDCCTFRPGVTWNEVITSVDRAELWWIDPSFFAIFQVWDIGLDNVALWAAGSSVVRNGSGVNPLDYAETSSANLGTTWDTTVTLGANDLVSVVAIGAAPLSGFFPGGIYTGELLVAPPALLVDVAAGAHSIPIPVSPSILGIVLPTQAFTVDDALTVDLKNALDIEIGG